MLLFVDHVFIAAVFATVSVSRILSFDRNKCSFVFLRWTELGTRFTRRSAFVFSFLFVRYLNSYKLLLHFACEKRLSTMCCRDVTRDGGKHFCYPKIIIIFFFSICTFRSLFCVSSAENEERKKLIIITIIRTK